MYPLPKQTKQVFLEFSGVLKFPAPPHFEHFILSIDVTSSEIICFKAIFGFSIIGLSTVVSIPTDNYKVKLLFLGHLKS